MFGLYRVALSLLILFSAIAAHAEDPFAAAFGGGFGAGVPSGYQSQGPYGPPGSFGGGFPGGPGFGGQQPQQGGGSPGEQMALQGCNVKCDEDRVAVAAAAYQNRNLQTSQSILGSGATASVSTGATACDPRYASMDPATLAALRADPVVGPAIQQAMAGCGAPSSGPVVPPVFADKGQCVQTCMAPFQAKYGGDPKNRIDPQMLIYLLQQGQGGDSNQEPTPPSEYGDTSDGRRGGTDDDFWSRAVANAKSNPVSTPEP